MVMALLSLNDSSSAKKKNVIQIHKWLDGLINKLNWWVMVIKVVNIQPYSNHVLDVQQDNNDFDKNGSRSL